MFFGFKVQGIKYEISGESCIPGIETKDVESIFEEHLILPTVSTSETEATGITYYAEKERIFNFGYVIANLSATNSGDNSEQQLDEKESSLDTRAVANFKIINPEKIPCTVMCCILPSEEHSSNGSDSSKESAMVVQPSQMEIPPHENR